MDEEKALNEAINWPKEREEQELQRKLQQKTKDLMEEFEARVFDVHITSNWKTKWRVEWSDEVWSSKIKLKDEY